MKLSHILLALGAAIACSCSADQIDVATSPIVVREFTATIGDGTKTSLEDGGKVLWDATGETITILDSQGNAYDFTQKSVSSDRRTATFTGSAPETGLVMAVYPASNTLSYDDGTISLTIPREQQALQGGFPATNLTMAKVTDGSNSLSFKNVCSMIGIQVNASDVTSVSLRATETSGGALAGKAIVDFDGDEPFAVSDITTGSNSVTLGGPLTSGNIYYLMAWPGTYSGLSITFTDSKGRTVTRSKDAEFTLRRSKILPMSTFTINDSEWTGGAPAGGTAMLTYSELNTPSNYVKGYDKPAVYTNSYGSWDICAYNASKSKAFQLNKGNVAYIGTPKFEGTITSVTVNNIAADRSGNFIICTEHGTTSAPSSGTVTGAFKGVCSVTIDVSSLAADKLYIRSSVMSHITEVTVVWGSGTPTPSEPTVTTLPADEIGMADATLHASFSGIPTSPDPTAAFFRWGTSASSMNNVVYDNETLLNTSAGSFSAPLTGLDESTTYYYQAVITLADGSDVEGAVMSFRTKSSQPTTDLGYLDCYEVPAVEVTGNMVSGNEASGRGYRWYRFDTPSSMRKVVTHTFKDPGKQTRNYTVLVDGNNKAPLWDAFIMHKDVFFDSNLGRGSWTTDPAVPSSWQNSETLGNYHKGHLVASNYRQNYTSARNQTFYYTNQAPQYQTKFNDGIWNSMEQRIVSIAPSGRDTLYVVVGVLYEGSVQQISGVPIPSHFYTCLMKCSFNTSKLMTGAQGCAYLFENRPYDGSSYNSYKCTIKSVEQRAGFDFFHNVPDEYESTAENQTAAIL